MYVTCVCRCLTVRSFLCLGWFWTLKQIYKSPGHQEETQVWTVRWSGAAVTLRSGLTGLRVQTCRRLMRGRVTGVLVDWLQVGDRRTNRKWYDFLDLSLFPLDTPDVSVRSTLKLSVVLWFSVGGRSGSTCSQKQLNFFDVWSSSAAGSNRTSDILKHTWRWSGWSCSSVISRQLSANDSVSCCEPSESVCHIFHLMTDIKTPTESLKQPSVSSRALFQPLHEPINDTAWFVWLLGVYEGNWSHFVFNPNSHRTEPGRRRLVFRTLIWSSGDQISDEETRHDITLSHTDVQITFVVACERHTLLIPSHVSTRPKISNQSEELLRMERLRLWVSGVRTVKVWNDWRLSHGCFKPFMVTFLKGITQSS